MTVAEQWEQKGIQKGVQQSKFSIAKNLLKLGLPDEKIIEATNIDQNSLNKLKLQ